MKMCYIYTVEYSGSTEKWNHDTTSDWVELEKIMLREVNEAQKDKHGIFSPSGDFSQQTFSSQGADVSKVRRDHWPRRVGDPERGINSGYK